MTEPAHAAHFASLEGQERASLLGMWLFIASELLLFTGFFVLYAAYRLRFPEAFAVGVSHSLKAVGSVNTAVLIVSSALIALSVPALRAGQHQRAKRLLAATWALGVVFLALKAFEYAAHIREGMVPGGRGAFFSEHPERGLALFVNLYFLATGAHAIHVIVGLAVIGAFFLRIRERAHPATEAHRLELGALYWHLVDLMWIFLWPLFYLIHGRPSA